jgi:DNA-directed RNA polymerase subunit F
MADKPEIHMIFGDTEIVTDEEGAQKIMDEWQDAMIEEQHDIEKRMGVDANTASAIQYLRTRSRWTQEKETELVDRYHAGNPIPLSSNGRVLMNDMDAIMFLEDFEEADEEDAARALQQLINSGTWGMQGSYGRSMMQAIEAGVCALGPNHAFDYYGNYIPSRDEVESGTKGSVEYVEKNSPFGKVLE